MRGHCDVCNRKAPSPVLLGPAQTQFKAQGSQLEPLWLQLLHLPWGFWTFPCCTCCLNPQLWAQEDFSPLFIPFSCFIYRQEVTKQPVTQPSLKATGQPTADKGLRASAKSQRGPGKGPRRGTLAPSHGKAKSRAAQDQQ